jgi:hypothetical protein
MTDTPKAPDPGLTAVPEALQAQLTAGYEAWRDRRPEALSVLETALALARAQGSRMGVIQAGHHLANLLFNLGRDAESADLHAEVLAEGRDLGLDLVMATSLFGKAHVDAVQGRLEDARRGYGEAMALYDAAERPEAETVRRALAYVTRLEAEGRLGEAFAHLRWAV